MTGIGRLVRLANHLGSIVHPGEGLVGGHHGKQVGEGADVVVGAPSGVLLLVHKGHDEGVDVVDNTLEEDQSSDAGELLPFPLSILLPGGCNILLSEINVY